MPTSGAGGFRTATPEERWSVRECATLGTKWRDVYRNDELFAREVPCELAEQFVKEPWMYGNVHADVPRLRRWVLEWEGAGARSAQVFTAGKIAYTRAAIASDLNDYLSDYSEVDLRFTADDQLLGDHICQEFVNRWAAIVTEDLQDDEAGVELQYDLLVHQLGFQANDQGTIIAAPALEAV